MHIITRGRQTWRAALIAAIAFGVAMQTQSFAQSQEQQVVNDAAAAIGGRDRVLAAKTLLIEGVGFDINYGQGHSWSDVGVQSEVFYLNPWKRTYELGPRRGRRIAPARSLGIDSQIPGPTRVNYAAIRRALLFSIEITMPWMQSDEW